jgi:hypothetical protein
MFAKSYQKNIYSFKNIPVCVCPQVYPPAEVTEQLAGTSSLLPLCGWVLGTECGSTELAANTFAHWATTLKPTFTLFKRNRKTLPKIFVWIAVFSKSSSETLEPLQPASKAFFLDFFLFIPFCGSYLEFSKVIAISVLIWKIALC